MDIALPQRRTLVLAVLTAAMTMGLLLGTPLGPGTAHAAGPNMNQGRCVMGYNYADPDSGYLFASSEAFGDCRTVNVQIWNEGSVTGGGWGPGFEGSSCMGWTLWANHWGWGYVSAGVHVDAANWTHPCSYHYAEDDWGWTYSQGGLYFLCPHYGCML